MKFHSNAEDPSYFPAPLPDCLCHVSFRRNSPVSVKVVEKPNKCKSLLVPFSWGTTPTVLQHIVSAIYDPPFGKVWLSCVCWFSCEAWQWRRKQNLHRVGKNGGPVWSRLWTKVHDILGRCRRPLAVVNALDRLSISCFTPSLRRYKPLKLPLSCQVVQKSVLDRRFVGGRDTPDFGHAFSNRSYFRACGRFWLSFVQRARRVAGEKR